MKLPIIERSKQHVKYGGRDIFSSSSSEDVPGFVLSSESISVGWSRMQHSWDGRGVTGLK